MVIQSIRRVASVAVNLVLPPRCAICGVEGTFICPTCQMQLPRLKGPFCRRCGAPLETNRVDRLGALGDRFNDAPNRGCVACASSDLTLDGVRSVWSLEGNARHLIHHFKFSGLRALGPSFGASLGEAQRGWSPPVEAVTWVPLHPRRLRQRGFDQSMILAQMVAHDTGIPLMKTLERTIATAQQVNAADREARRENTQGAFRVANHAQIQGEQLLLIDDVFTTGATLSAASDALRAGGTHGVWGLTLARQL